MRRVLLTYVALCDLSAGAAAADIPVVAEPAAVASAVPPVFSFEGGLRYWYSSGEASKELYNADGAVMISRLTYSDLGALSGEVFLNATHNLTGIFVKGFISAAGIAQGALTDEDFLDEEPYSRTLSDQHNGRITYFTADLGYNFWNTPRYRVGAYVGYNFWHESYHAIHCAQQAANPRICVPAITTNMGGVSENDDWHSLQLGLAGQTQLTERLSLSGDVAVLFTRLDGKDQHHLRPEINPVPEDGNGYGVQLEAMLNYKVTDLFNIGVGARYWRAGAAGAAHFEETPGGGAPAILPLEVERYGVFGQASIKFD